MRRHDFITLLGTAAATLPRTAHAQQPAMPVIAVLSGRSADASVRVAAAFRDGLNEAGYAEGKNVTVEYHWLVGQYDRLPAVLADLIHRQVAVIAVPGSAPAVLAAKAATATIPIVFGVAQDPVRLGLVANLARPGGNATGVNFFVAEVITKRLRLLHDMVPKAVRVAVLVDPANVSNTETTLHTVQEAAHALGLQIAIVNATTISEIDAAFGDRDTVAAGGLMSYGTILEDMYRQVGIYTGSVLKGAKPADLPVLQSTKFELVINLQTARALGIEVPSGLLSIADEVIE